VCTRQVGRQEEARCDLRGEEVRRESAIGLQRGWKREGGDWVVVKGIRETMNHQRPPLPSLRVCTVQGGIDPRFSPVDRPSTLALAGEGQASVGGGKGRSGGGVGMSAHR
jgi:hypothetical protein